MSANNFKILQVVKIYHTLLFLEAIASIVYMLTNYVPTKISGKTDPASVVGTMFIASVVPTRLVENADPESVVETAAVARVVPTKFVETAVPTVIVETAYYWKSCRLTSKTKEGGLKDIDWIQIQL